MDKLLHKFLSKEAAICKDIWNEYHENDNEHKLEHYHICDFELLTYGLIKHTKKKSMYTRKKCNEYLKSVKKKRNPYMCCCDNCPHEKYVTVTQDGFIINIASLVGLERE